MNAVRMAKKPKSKSKRTIKATAGDNTPKIHRNLRPPWKPGVSGNPMGRPKGARVVFGEDFVRQFAAHWEKHGEAALDSLFQKNKEGYVRVAVALLPKLIDLSGEVEHRVHERIPWDDIRKRCEQYRDTERKPRLDS